MRTYYDAEGRPRGYSVGTVGTVGIALWDMIALSVALWVAIWPVWAVFAGTGLEPLWGGLALGAEAAALVAWRLAVRSRRPGSGARRRPHDVLVQGSDPRVPPVRMRYTDSGWQAVMDSGPAPARAKGRHRR